MFKALLHNLNEKVRHYPSTKKVLHTIFLLNNIHYIVKSLSNSPLESSVGRGEVEKLRKKTMDLKKKYAKDAWSKVENYIDLKNV